ncbi:serine/threonine-protein kinase [Haloglycomyces albus]|uniref:serine/threonine-protein kinase n=1 Tax=Haloglycomyces albus TaxID=526067 RepID=UPI000688C4E8|nr:serine/threonine-protein kinase [Haloglycomyces albus]
MSYFNDPNGPAMPEGQQPSGAFGNRFQTASWNQSSPNVTTNSGIGNQPIPEQREPQIGDHIGGRYQLTNLIGRGGNGSVWQGLDTTLQRDVAVKAVTLPKEISADEQQQLIERSMREAQITAGISHPSVIRVFDVVQDGGRPWIVMELLQARSLAEILESDGPLPLRVVCKIGLALTGALQAAHEAGIIHRDIKPGNVLITADGRCILTDFGAAQQHSLSGGTAPGKVLGSAHYIAPERAVGGKAEPGSDVFSLGVSLYAACEGRPPFHRGDVISTMRAVVNEPPESPLNAGALTPLLGAMLKKDPQQRITLNEARHELSALLSGPFSESTNSPILNSGVHPAASNDNRNDDPEPPRPTARREPSERPERESKSNSGKVVAIIGVLVLVIGGLGFLGYLWTQDGDDSSNDSETASDESNAGPDEEPPSEDELTDGEEKPSLETATFDGEGYSADHPADWQQGPDGDDYNVFVNPEDDSHWARYYNNSYQLQDQDPETHLTQLANNYGGEIVTSEAVDISGYDGHLVEYTNTGDDGVEYHSWFALAYGPNGFTWGVYVSGAEKHADVSQQTFDAALESFTLN